LGVRCAGDSRIVAAAVSGIFRECAGFAEPLRASTAAGGFREENTMNVSDFALSKSRLLVDFLLF
jgi:hypothetical protein